MARSHRRTPPAPSAAQQRAALPAARAFVVQLRADADLERGVLRGRLEHLTSGVAAVFESAEELVARMREALQPGAPSEPDERE
jgi:hypothetical protein